MRDFDAARRAMVERQIAARGISGPALLDAFLEVPREAFVPDDLAAFAYDDGPLPIGAGQTISQPYIVALMIDAAGVAPGQSVLEIGAGSGYAAAVMSRIAARVIAIERHEDLAKAAAARLRLLGYDNVEIIAGDGSRGWPERAPYDAILAAASGPRPVAALLDQLAPEGRLVMPVGAPDSIQQLRRFRRGPDAMVEDDLGAVRFVPLIGAAGWAE